MADVLADQVVAGHRDQVAAPQIAEPEQDLRHAHGHRGLAGAGIAGEAHVQAGRAGGKAARPAQLVHQKQRGYVPDARLHRRQSDQLAVQLRQQFTDAGRGQRGGQRIAIGIGVSWRG
jgi:hypothetical protein